MTLDQLAAYIEKARWFSNLGSYGAAPGQLAIVSLRAWADEEAEYDRVAALMEWLPSQAHDADPVHADQLESRAEERGQSPEAAQQALSFYKRALESLRRAHKSPLLQVGPHSFEHVAHGAAAYACRRAALEIFLGQSGFWCDLIQLYAQGHWPCGLLPDKTLVVL